MDLNCSLLLGNDCSTGNDVSSNNISCDLHNLWSHPDCIPTASDSGILGSRNASHTTSASYTTTPTKKPPLIDDELKRTLELYINVIGFIVTSLIGVIANVINIAVYWKQGLTNSITLGFFALSISDLLLVAMPLFTGTMYAAKYVLQDSPIDFSSIHYVSFGWVRNFTYSCSLLITAFLSLERCCCIALPFKVQTIFTRKRTAIFLLLTFLFHATCLFLLPAIVQLKWQANPSVINVDKNNNSNNNDNNNNSSGSDSNTKLRVWFSDFGREMEVFYSTSMSFIVPVGCQIIVTVCAVIMVRGLRKASRFRAQVTSTGGGGGGGGGGGSGIGSTHAQSDDVEDEITSSATSVQRDTIITNTDDDPRKDPSTANTTYVIRSSNDSNSKTNNNKNSKGRQLKTLTASSTAGATNTSKERSTTTPTLTQRDARLVRTMVFLVCILSACNVPFLAATFAWRTVPDLNIGRPYQNTLSVLFSLVYILGNVNAASNTLVYFKTSARFRQVFKEIFSHTNNKT